MGYVNPNPPQPPQKAEIDYVTFWVPGKPIGQGNIRMNSQGRGYHANSGLLQPWRHNIGYCARMARTPLLAVEIPVKLKLNFYFAKPKSVTREYPTVPPDIDHLIRAVGDALKGIAYVDDSQIVSVEMAEFYGQQGVEISVGQLLT